LARFSQFETDDIIEQYNLLTRVAGLVDNGTIKISVFENSGKINVCNLIKVHTLLESGKSTKKIILSVFD